MLQGLCTISRLETRRTCEEMAGETMEIHDFQLISVYSTIFAKSTISEIIQAY